MTLDNRAELIAGQSQIVAASCESTALSKGKARAVLYARVSSDTQQKEATIESQLFELRRQIAAAGHVLVQEYVDDGVTGILLERPALEELRQDAKADVFDRIYFHAADRIAREAAHQTIIIGELVRRGKQITIGGKDYEGTPEGKLTLNLLGLFSEYERAKIIERTTRGRLHKLRMGEMSSNCHRIYGYHYVKKTPTAPATLAINEEQAAIVRQIFEMFASGDYGIITIARFLEERRIPTRMGRPQWDRGQIKFMLKNETYTGTRHYNRITAVTEANRKGNKMIRGKWVYRDRAEWIAVNVPAVVSRELFDKVQERLALHDKRYCKPATHYLLSGLVQCGVCKSRCSSTSGHHKVVRPSGKISVYHQAQYRCNRRARENAHDRTQIEHCNNSAIATHILEGQVWEMIRDTMIDPAKLRGSIKDDAAPNDQSIARELVRVAGHIKLLDDERRRIIGLYAHEQMGGEEYIAANRALDKDLERLRRRKAELAAALRSPQHENFVDASIRQFCANANARFHSCGDFDTKRQFIVDHVERVSYTGYKIAVLGSVPVQSASGQAKLQFRIRAEIDKSAVRRGSGELIHGVRPSSRCSFIG
jgi:site-specific DNA recombinase